jgi:hypothetical protein
MGVSRKVLLALIVQLSLVNPAADAMPGEDAYRIYEYLSPIPFSPNHNPETAILIRFGEAVDILSLKDDLLEVTGSHSWRHTGRFTLSNDKLTLIFVPSVIFSPGEKVNIALQEGIRTLSGKILPSFVYWFTIRDIPNSGQPTAMPDISGSGRDINGRNPRNALKSKGSLMSYLDFKLAGITMTGQTAGGNIITTLVDGIKNYLYIFDNKAIPVYTKLMPGQVTNLKPQPAGRLTYYDYSIKGFVVLDSLMEAVDTLVMKNGYKADSHEILILPDGHTMMFCYDLKVVDMSKIVEGGNTSATLTGLVIQELDESSNLIFQWRSWDYFNITDTYSDLLTSAINLVHGNSLDADSDTTLIVSSRNMNEVTKISRLTGKIIWRLGGRHNEFVFENDPRRFAGQHSAMRQKNGNLTMFDNGLGLEPLYSRGIEYEINESAKKVKLTHEFRHNPDIYANVSGNLQRLDNGNTLIFWGPATDREDKIISEFNSEGDSVFVARFGSGLYPTYRAYRADRNPAIFTFSSDTVNVVSEIQNAPVFRSLTIRNNSHSTISITSAHHLNLGFYVADLPVTIEAGSETTVNVAFPSFRKGILSDNIYFCLETDSMLVTRSIFVTINNLPGTGVEDMPDSFLKVYPNPGKGNFLAELRQEGRYTLHVTDLYGRVVWEAKVYGTGSVNIDLNGKPEGLYILHLKEVNTGVVLSVKLIRQK